MKVYTYYTPSHKVFFDDYFSKSLMDLEIVEFNGDQECQSGSYYKDGWKSTTMKKVDVFIQACKENQGNVFVYSDVDIQFFKPLNDVLLEELGEFDIAIQNDYLGGMCSGFFVCRGNEKTLKMFEEMKSNETQYLEDQHALNMNLKHVRYKALSTKFWTFGSFGTQWKGQNFDIPQDLVMHHANWTEGIDNKIKLLNFVRFKQNLRNQVEQQSVDYQKFLYDFFSEFRKTPTYPVYPPYHTGDYLDLYFCNFFKDEKIGKEIYFLPIDWTTSYIENNNLGLLQEKLLALDRSKNYFSVSQHDDAIREHLPFNIQKFCAGGNAGGTPIPLVCSKIPNNLISEGERDIFCSFVGSITHPIRKKLHEELSQRDGYQFVSKNWTNSVSSDDFEKFVDVTSRSKFTLCPRGYGKSSFRLYESMQLGSVPVYVYDDDWRCFKDELVWDEFSVSIHSDNIEKLDSILRSISDEEILEMSQKAKKCYDDHFSLESLSNKIIKSL